MTLALTLDPTLFVSALLALSGLWATAQGLRYLIARMAALSGKENAR